MITHLQQKAFVRKYNSELAIKGYTKLTKTSLFQRIEDTLKRSRTELKREWASMKSGPAAKPLVYVCSRWCMYVAVGGPLG